MHWRQRGFSQLRVDPLSIFAHIFPAKRVFCACVILRQVQNMAFYGQVCRRTILPARVLVRPLALSRSI